MTLKQILLVSAAACVVLGGAGSAQAQDGWLTTYETNLAQAHVAVAQAIADAQVKEAPDNPSAHFAAGAAHFLVAVETFGQTLHRYGLQSMYRSDFTGGMPFVSLPIANNPNPEPVTYEKLRAALRDLADGLDAAEVELAGVPSGPVSMRLDLAHIYLDLDESGDATGDVPLITMLAILTGGFSGTQQFSAITTLPVDLDESDVLWLRAYCHLLSAMADFMLGYDWQDGYNASFYALFPSGEYPASAVIDGIRADTKRLAELGGPTSYPFFSDQSQVQNSEALSPDRKRELERNLVQQRLDWGGIADLVAFIHLAHWPVVDPGRLRDVHTDLKAMVALSRAEWKSILAETDTDSNELLPNPSQHGVFPGAHMDQARIDGWMMLLDQFDGLLDGTILIPHWRFDKGVNLRRFFLEPTPFDPVMLFQGQAATPYLEDGPKAESAVWNQIVTVFNGDFLRYFFWIN